MDEEPFFVGERLFWLGCDGCYLVVAYFRVGLEDVLLHSCSIPTSSDMAVEEFKSHVDVVFFINAWNSVKCV